VSERDRKTILDSLRLFGGTLSQSQAATKYGVPSGTIGRWTKERKEGRVVELKVAPPPAPEPSPHAREAIRGREVRAAEMARAMGDEARSDLRDAVAGLTRFLGSAAKRASQGEDVDMVQLAAGARALDALLTRAADVLAFDTRTQAPTDRDILTDADAVSREVRLRRRG